jgi:hypothetical protein
MATSPWAALWFDHWRSVMGLRDTYAYAIQTAKGKFHGNAEERDGKLHWKGTVGTEAEKNEIWGAIKTIPTWQNDIVADIQVTGGAGASPAAAPAAGAYMKIFELNKDQLSDPDKIKPGQVLRLP